MEWRVTLWWSRASLRGWHLSKDLIDEKEGSYIKNAMDEEQGRGISQCRRPFIQIREWKENQRCWAIWTSNRSAAGELGKVGMGQVMYGLLGCEEYGLSLMQWEATGELPNLILALSRSSCSLYEEWALRRKEWKQRDHLGDLEKIRQRWFL